LEDGPRPAGPGVVVLVIDEGGAVHQKDDLDELLGLLELIPGILRDFADLAPDGLDDGIDDALRRIGEFAAVDRSYMFLFDPDIELMDNTHEWCASGVEPQIDDLQRVPAESVGWWLPQFEQGNAVYVPSVADLPDERAEERDLLAPQDIVSLVTVPLLTAGRLMGFIGFDSVREQRAWSDGAIMLLRAVADAICSALMRREAIEALTEREERFRALVRHSSDVVMVLDEGGSVSYLGPSAGQILGWNVDNRIGTTLLDAVHPKDRDRVQCSLDRAAEQPGSDITVPDHRLLHTDGTWRWFLATAVDLRNDEHIGGVVVNAHDITTRKLAEEALQHQALHDPLTGLPNRALLLDRLQQALERTRRSERSVGVVFLDLDRFKLINDSLGHNMGDDLLIEVARRLADTVRSCDTVARFGGDEFVILLDDVEDSSEALRGSDRLLEVFQQPFRIGHRDHVVTASAGVVVGTDQGDPEAILRDADAAMYQAKESGRARIQRFDAPLREALLLRVELAQDLHGSIERSELSLEYQPLFHLCDDLLIGVEALLRWRHPRRGWIPPTEFIPIAEEHGLIVPLGRFVLDTALRQLRGWDEQHPKLRGLSVSVNLSVHQLTEDDLPGTVSDLLAQHGIQPSRLCLELTESALMEEPVAGRAILGQLRELGVNLAIDDFGTGYSSLAYLRELPVTSLKIDRSFMTGLGTDDRDARVITAIIGLAHEFDLAVVGEGIETAMQLRELRRLGCDIGQGYFLQRPVPPSLVPHLDVVQGSEAS
jgi:diguanylate cyclase (GGDEF)-like protein/PAS domain S-box-containing protein